MALFDELDDSSKQKVIKRAPEHLPRSVERQCIIGIYFNENYSFFACSETGIGCWASATAAGWSRGNLNAKQGKRPTLGRAMVGGKHAPHLHHAIGPGSSVGSV